jgi:hypothetical protein
MSLMKHDELLFGVKNIPAMDARSAPRQLSRKQKNPKPILFNDEPETLSL